MHCMSVCRKRKSAPYCSVMENSGLCGCFPALDYLVLVLLNEKEKQKKQCIGDSNCLSFLKRDRHLCCNNRPPAPNTPDGNDAFARCQGNEGKENEELR